MAKRSGTGMGGDKSGRLAGVAKRVGDRQGWRKERGTGRGGENSG